MKTLDVRIRALLLTVALVVMIAAVVQFWPDKPTMLTQPDAVDVSAEDEQVKRHFDWAVAQLRAGHLEQAIPGFQAVLEQAPAMPEAYVNMGFAHVGLEQYEQALQAFETAIEIRPQQVNAYWGLAVSLEGLCDIPGAMGAMRTYVHLAEPEEPYLAKANAALWEWEQLKTAGKDGEQVDHPCRDQKGQAQNSRHTRGGGYLLTP